MDSPPAFPLSQSMCVGPDGRLAFSGEYGYSEDGMSLRDYFAGQALTRTASFSPEAAATSAYQIADAMLAERSKAVAR